MNKFKTHPWSSEENPTEDAIRNILKNEGLNPYSWSNSPGDVYSVHSHSYYKVLYVVQGSITFGFPEDKQRVTMHPGDRLELSPGVAHDAVVGSKGVVCLEAHRS